MQKQQAAQSRQGYHGSHRPQGPVTPKLSWAYHNYTSMTHFLRHVSTVYSNLTALYSIGQSVQGNHSYTIVVNASKKDLDFSGNLKIHNAYFLFQEEKCG